MPNHEWYYLKTTLLNEDQIGPVAESEFKKLASSGELKPKTAIMSPTRTKGQWTEVQKIPGVLQLVERGAADRKREKQAAKEQKQAEKARQKEANQVTAIESPRNDESSTVRKIKKHVSNYLTNGEEIEFVLCQAKPVVVKSDAVVVTNRRLMIVKPKLLGRFEFFDMLWRDLVDAHIQENVFGATFSMKDKKKGQNLTIDMLPKKGARELYRIAQEREEQAEEIRRNRKMEETAAGAAKINVGAMDSGTAPQDSNSPMERLKQLKEMLDADLISEDDFNKRKAEILDRV